MNGCHAKKHRKSDRKCRTDDHNQRYHRCGHPDLGSDYNSALAGLVTCRVIETESECLKSYMYGFPHRRISGNEEGWAGSFFLRRIRGEEQSLTGRLLGRIWFSRQKKPLEYCAASRLPEPRIYKRGQFHECMGFKSSQTSCTR